MIPLAKQSTIEIPGAKQSTKLKVKTEKSAVVFTLVVILFLLTNNIVITSLHSIMVK